MTPIRTTPNADLAIVPGNKGHWCHADYRRHGWQNLHTIARYGMSLRSADVMSLEKSTDLRIAELEGVRHLTSLPWFSALLVVRGQKILFERYAPDFGPHLPHSIQSITKTTMNLVIGQLVEQKVLDLSRSVDHYIPEIGSGYARATLQQVLNMDVVNNYSEDFTDPQAAYYAHEEAMGWRLPRDPAHEETEHSFLPRIESADTTNHSGRTHYKDANTAVLAWVAERASGRPMRAFLTSIVDAAGVEGAFYITTDREGVPTLEGGACLTARDLARYFSLFVRGGLGIRGESVSSDAFLEKTLSSGVAMPFPYEGLRYSNHLMVLGRSLGHAGWGGQYVMANMDTGTIGVYFSVLENEHANNQGGYMGSVIRLLNSITGMRSDDPIR
jgi:CubicO group peptidase (beta-lactamase class C family)